MIQLVVPFLSVTSKGLSGRRALDEDNVPEMVREAVTRGLAVDLFGFDIPQWARR